MPRVSVIVPTFNCARFIGAALESVLAQSYRDYEVIVVDDGSTDDTGAVLDAWKGRISYLLQTNQGPAAARNRAVALSNGEFIAYLDADDLWLPGKLAQQVAFLDEHPECGLVHGEVGVIDESGQLLYERYRNARGRVVLRGHCATELLKHSVIHMPTVIERRRSYDESGGFDEGLRYAEDYLHWLRLAINGHAFGYIDEPLALYRWRAGSLARDGTADARRSEALLRVYGSLLSDHNARSRLRMEDLKATRGQIAALHRSLSYEYRQMGQRAHARKHAIEWVRAMPMTAAPYAEWLKSFFPRRSIRART